MSPARQLLATDESHLRVVFDTNTVISALLFSQGRLAWLRQHWFQRTCVPLLSAATAAELHRVLTYPKFALTPADRLELLGDYLPYCEIIEASTPCPVQCRDPKDQPFLDLAESGHADVLVTGDGDLLSVCDQTRFTIETADTYRQRFS